MVKVNIGQELLKRRITRPHLEFYENQLLRAEGKKNVITTSMLDEIKRNYPKWHPVVKKYLTHGKRVGSIVRKSRGAAAGWQLSDDWHQALLEHIKKRQGPVPHS
ncbi:TPA: hypothetical protein HA244_00195 [Candidatus Micrarchaeota archaeon]|nr:hypothetical protein [Candidatus Micrarchaeota archaeon]